MQNTEAGVASALLNVGQQVGGAIGLSVLATVAATAGRHAATSNQHLLQQGMGSMPPQLQQQVGGFLGQSGWQRPGQDRDQGLRQPAARQRAVGGEEFFSGPFHEYASTVQAHSSGMGFLAAAVFGDRRDASPPSP